MPEPSCSPGGTASALAGLTCRAWCRSKSRERERKLRSMDSVDVLESGDLESSVQASLLEAELQGTGATRSAVELSLDEDKVCCTASLWRLESCVRPPSRGGLTHAACRGWTDHEYVGCLKCCILYRSPIYKINKALAGGLDQGAYTPLDPP